MLAGREHPQRSLATARASSSARFAGVLATCRSARASSLLTGMARLRRRLPNMCFSSLPNPAAFGGLSRSAHGRHSCPVYAAYKAQLLPSG